jgi:hypothetical protein
MRKFFCTLSLFLGIVLLTAGLIWFLCQVPLKVKALVVYGTAAILIIVLLWKLASVACAALRDEEE